MDPRFENIPRSHRLWPPTGRGLDGGFLSVVLAIRILFSDICPGIRREILFGMKKRCLREVGKLRYTFRL